MYFSKTPEIIKPFARHLLWQVATKENQLFLTFDDGPTPGVTDLVLDLLQKYNARATFFCVGKNVIEHPLLFKQIVERGHTVGNHTHNHLNGWETSKLNYLKNYLTCLNTFQSPWFRPPYGKITRSQAKAIGLRSKIVMWDVLSGDFDPKSSKEACLNRVIKHAKQGSIVVLHDSEKCKEKMLFALEGTLEHFSNLSYSFLGLNDYEFGQT